MDTKVLIGVEKLFRYYGHHLAVDAISFELAQGEVLGFLGPNGAGKSTTMQMITGNLAPSAGKISINGIDLLDTDGPRGEEISQEQYARLSPEDVGAVDYFRRTVSGREIPVGSLCEVLVRLKLGARGMRPGGRINPNGTNSSIKRGKSYDESE